MASDDSPELKAKENMNVLKWLENRNGKLLTNLDTGTKFDNTRDIGPMFLIEEICNEHIEPNFRLSITKVLDPMESWHKQNADLMLVDPFTRIEDFLTLRPDTFTTSAILDAYLKVLQTYNDEILLIGPGLLTLFANKKKTKDKIQEKINQAKYIMICSNIRHNHWVVYQFPIPTTKQDTLEIFVADSLNTSGNSPSFRLDSQYPLAHFLCYFFLSDNINNGLVGRKIHMSTTFFSKALTPQSQDALLFHAFQFKFANNVKSQTEPADCGINCMYHIHKTMISPDPQNPVDILPDFVSTRIYRLQMLVAMIKHNKDRVNILILSKEEQKDRLLSLNDEKEHKAKIAQNLKLNKNNVDNFYEDRSIDSEDQHK